MEAKYDIKYMEAKHAIEYMEAKHNTKYMEAKQNVKQSLLKFSKTAGAVLNPNGRRDHQNKESQLSSVVSQSDYIN